MKNKIRFLAILICLSISFVCSACEPKTKILTESQLIEAINVEKLSTSEFIHNGIAQIDKGKKIYNVSYHARVKIGVNLSDIEFLIDNDNQTVDIVLPLITVNSVEVDPANISFIPSNPDMELGEILSLCEEDALSEANKSDELYQLAQENIKSAVQALIEPILEAENYTINQWHATSLTREVIE